jgi:hypothetical protein
VQGELVALEHAAIAVLQLVKKGWSVPAVLEEEVGPGQGKVARMAVTFLKVSLVTSPVPMGTTHSKSCQSDGRSAVGEGLAVIVGKQMSSWVKHS